jgi:hypothetical protein
MQTWDEPGRTIRADVIREIVRGRLAADADPRGLRLRGARVAGRIDLENITRDLEVRLFNCFLPDGILLRDATLLGFDLNGSWIGQPSDSSDPPIDASRFTARTLRLAGATIIATGNAGTVRLIGAHLGLLDFDGARLENTAGPALIARDLRVDQGMYLSDGFSAAGRSEHGTIQLVGAQLGLMDFGGARLENTTGPAMRADRLQVDQGMFLRDGFTATGSSEDGTIELGGAHVGRLECDGARLENTAGPALGAEGLRVDQEVFMRDGFTAIGGGDHATIDLAGAHVGRLECDGARLENTAGPALGASDLRVDQGMYLRDGFNATGSSEHGTIQLTGASIGGELWLDVDSIISATTGHKGSIDLDGTNYTGLPKPGSLKQWLRLLREHTPRYAAQPYQQLAAAHRAAGHDREVRTILMAQRRDQIRRRAIIGRDRTWSRFTGLTIGFGYQPWRALILLLGVLILSVTTALVAGHNGGLAHTSKAATPATTCTILEQVGVGLDLGTPLIKTGARELCSPTTADAGQTLTAAGWFLQALAWAFAALFIAGFTAAVRKT